MTSGCGRSRTEAFAQRRRLLQGGLGREVCRALPGVGVGVPVCVQWRNQTHSRHATRETPALEVSVGVVRAQTEGSSGRGLTEEAAGPETGPHQATWAQG